MLAERAEVRDFDPWGLDVADFLLSATTKFGKPANGAFELKDSQALAALQERTVFQTPPHRRSPPEHRNGIPKPFQRGIKQAQATTLRLLTLENAYVCHVSDAPVIVTADRAHIVANYSSKYAGLVHFYDHDLNGQLDAALEIDGPALILAGDNRGTNYCHWTVDTLPRLACLRDLADLSDVRIITGPLKAQFQRDALRICGFDDARIVECAPFQAVRARTLMVPEDLHRSLHPACKAAPWAIGFLRETLGRDTPIRAAAPRNGTRLYISRGDAAHRRVVNEDELVAELGRLNYVPLRLSDMSVQQQVSAFSQASHVVGPHGAGLANIVFAQAGAQLIELFSSEYGTPAFYMLAEGSRVRYASYVAEQLVRSGRPLTDDIVVDTGKFLANCRDLL